MTLEEAFKAKHLLQLVLFKGWKPCGKLTGRYFYETATGSEDEIMARFRASRDDIHNRVAALVTRIGQYPPTGATY